MSPWIRIQTLIMNLNGRDRSIDTIAETIGRRPALTNDENLRQFELLWAGDKGVRESIINGNMHWILRLVTEMDNQSDITTSDLVAAARLGLSDAVDNFTNPEFDFAPDESLQNGYAIWWVRLKLTQLAKQQGLVYKSASNAMS